jgi:hypothetical protein
MENNKSKTEINIDLFNDEPVWDHDLSLFDKYFKNMILKNRHPISKFNVSNDESFVDSVKKIKHDFLNKNYKK